VHKQKPAVIQTKALALRTSLNSDIHLFSDPNSTGDSQGCPIDVNGVAETTVDAGQDHACVDTGDEALCSLVTGGLLSCSIDFCPGVCPHASACDATCGYCQQPDGGGGDDGDDHGGRRSLQINIHDSPCSSAEFQSRTDRVNVQCCDDNQCGSGAKNKRPFGRIIILKSSAYQDRLGTNIRNVEKQGVIRRGAFKLRREMSARPPLPPCPRAAPLAKHLKVVLAGV
jgi:hypothetical protein